MQANPNVTVVGNLGYQIGNSEGVLAVGLSGNSVEVTDVVQKSTSHINDGYSTARSFCQYSTENFT